MGQLYLVKARIFQRTTLQKGDTPLPPPTGPLHHQQLANQLKDLALPTQNVLHKPIPQVQRPLVFIIAVPPLPVAHKDRHIFIQDTMILLKAMSFLTNRTDPPFPQSIQYRQAQLLPSRIPLSSSLLFHVYSTDILYRCRKRLQAEDREIFRGRMQILWARQSR